MTNATGLVADSEFEPNPEQRAVIEAAIGEWLLVVAGPGTGKTQVAAMRLVHLIREGLQPAQILVLSFSRSAVATLTRRLAALRLADAGVVEDLRHLAIRTFDSWAFRILRQGGAAVSELLARQHDENIVAATAAFTDGTNTAISERLAGIRHVTGNDEPARKGKFSSCDRSTISLAHSKFHERCLSLNTGTLRPSSRNTSAICRKNS